MSAKLFPGLFFAATIFFFGGTIFAVQFKNVESVRDSDVVISKSVGLNLSGVISTTDIKLVDELGMEYDTFSLLKSDIIKEEIGLSDEQYVDIYRLHSELVKEVESELTDLMRADKGRKEYFEQRLYEVEDAMTDLLDDTQSVRLSQVKMQAGIARFGMNKFLSMKHVQEHLKLNPEKLDAINLAGTEAESDSAETMKQMFVSANEQLIAELSIEQREQIEGLFGDDILEALLAKPLFSGKNHKSLSDRIVRTSLVQLIRNSQVAKELELEADQSQQITELRRDLFEVEQFGPAIEEGPEQRAVGEIQQTFSCETDRSLGHRAWIGKRLFDRIALARKRRCRSHH